MERKYPCVRKRTSPLCRVNFTGWPFIEGGTGLSMLAVSWDSAEAFVNVCHFHFISVFRMTSSRWHRGTFSNKVHNVMNGTYSKLFTMPAHVKIIVWMLNNFWEMTYRLRQYLMTATQGNPRKQGASASICHWRRDMGALNPHRCFCSKLQNRHYRLLSFQLERPRFGKIFEKVFWRRCYQDNWGCYGLEKEGYSDTIVLSRVSAATGGRLWIALSGGATISHERQEFLTTALVIMVRYRKDMISRCYPDS